MEVDLHIHSRYSRDSRSRPEDIVRRAVEVGLGAIAVTDHDTIEGAKACAKIAPKELLIVPGVELKSEKGDLLALFIEEDVRRGTFGDMVEGIRATGGLAIVPHPAVSRLTVDDIRLADGVEGFNATLCAVDNATSRKMAEEAGLPSIGSSDAHLVNEIGNGRTRIRDSSSLEELRKNLLDGPVISRSVRSNPVVHRTNEAFVFGIKGIWSRL